MLCLISSLRNLFTSMILTRTAHFTIWDLSERREFGKILTPLGRYSLSLQLLVLVQSTSLWEELPQIAELKTNHSLTSELTWETEGHFYPLATLWETETLQLTLSWTGTSKDPMTRSIGSFSIVEFTWTTPVRPKTKTIRSTLSRRVVPPHGVSTLIPTARSAMTAIASSESCKLARTVQARTTLLFQGLNFTVKSPKADGLERTFKRPFVDWERDWYPLSYFKILKHTPIH